MKREPLDAEIKTRLSSKDKKALETEASRRFLKSADIVREAIREYLERSRSIQKAA